ncbi:MAG: PAS domain-containing protein [Bacteroidota bacterium]
MTKVKFSIKRLIITCFLLLTVIAFINILTINYHESKQEKDSVLVDVSGRNRMLSQRIAFYSEMIVHGNASVHNDLAKSIKLHDSSLQVLRLGGVAPGVSHNMVFSKAEESMIPAIEKVERLWSDYKTNADIILNSNNASDNEEQIAEALSFIEKNSKQMLFLNNELVRGYVALNQGKKRLLDITLLIILVVNLGVIVLAYILAKKHILKPIKQISDASVTIADGRLKERLEKHSDPDIDRLVNSINQLSNNLNQSAVFAEHIGNGEFDFEIDDVESNLLFNQLSLMRDKLAQVAEEDSKRNWSTEGLAQFGEVLRTYQNDIDELSDRVISNMVKYLGVNQGGIFIVNEKNPDDPHLELKACYAWERKKHLNNKINKGQGLAGQCWLERDIIYMTDIPKDYVNITSGLGSSTPNCVLITPLMINDEVLGVMELAGFNALDDFQIEFVRKVGENIASALSTAQTNSQTSRLLEESQVQTEQMRAQEEEIRQHMEEMQATQEEMERTRIELDGTMNAVNANSAVIEFDLSGHIITANELFLSMMKYTLDEIKGKHHSIFVNQAYANSPEYRLFWNDLKAGDSQFGEFKRKIKGGKDVWLSASYSPVLDASGKVLKVLKIAKNSTEEKITSLKYENQIKAINKSQGVVEFNLDGTILNANGIFLDITGYTLKELKNQHHRIFCEEEYANSKEYLNFWKRLNNGEFLNGQFTRITKNGDEICIHAVYTPIPGIDGKPTKVIKFISHYSLKENLMKELYSNRPPN